MLEDGRKVTRNDTIGSTWRTMILVSGTRGGRGRRVIFQAELMLPRERNDHFTIPLRRAT